MTRKRLANLTGRRVELLAEPSVLVLAPGMCTTGVGNSVVGIPMDALPDDAVVYYMSCDQIATSVLNY